MKSLEPEIELARQIESDLDDTIRKQARERQVAFAAFAFLVLLVLVLIFVR